MTLRSGLLRLVRSLSADYSDRRRLGAALIRLYRHRRRSLSVLGPLLRIVPNGDKVKLQMWQHLARTSAGDRLQGTFAEESSVVAAAVRSTQAYADAALALSRDRNGFLQRGPEYAQLRRRWRAQTPQRLLVFHHYDRRGLLTSSWREALLALQSAGWQVVLSSAHVDSAESALLETFGVQTARRVNIGLCLGAYRDLTLLLHSTPEMLQHLEALVFCNDSNLLVQPPQVLISQLERWTLHQPTSRPVLASMTDSVERNRYHLQSFLLHANQALLQHPAWLRFWLHFSIDGSKDDLIDHGEIGLSQALLAAGVELQPSYPLVQGLLTDPAMAEELQGYGIAQPEHVNQSLFAWRSLLARGFPLVKKHVLFQLVEHQGQPMAMSELARLIPKERRALLTRDIEQLLISRYSGGLPQMG